MSNSACAIAMTARLAPRRAAMKHRLRCPRSTQSIGRYRCQLNVGILQHLLNAIRNPVDLLYQTHAISREIAKFTRGAGARDNFHRATPFHRAASDASKKRKSPTRALRNFWRLQFVVLPSVPVILVGGLCERQTETTSVTTRLHKRYAISSPFSSFVVALK